MCLDVMCVCGHHGLSLVPARMGQCKGGVETVKIERFKKEGEYLFIKRIKKSPLLN